MEVDLNKVLVAVRQQLPYVIAIQGSPYHSESQGGVENSNKVAQERLGFWMKTHNTLHWYLGLNHLNYCALVEDVNRATKMTPYEFMWGRPPPQTGLVNMRLHSKIFETWFCESLAVGFLMHGGPAPLLQAFWDDQPGAAPLEMFGDDARHRLRVAHSRHPDWFPEDTDPATLDRYLDTISNPNEAANRRLVAQLLEAQAANEELQEKCDNLLNINNKLKVAMATSSTEAPSSPNNSLFGATPQPPPCSDHCRVCVCVLFRTRMVPVPDTPTRNSCTLLGWLQAARAPGMSLLLM
jgi:hypothetical protein